MEEEKTGIKMSVEGNGKRTILMADDDEDDCLLVKEAFEECGQPGELRFVGDGIELMEYLHRLGKYRDAPCPDLILLDLNMPGKDGRQALIEIKSDRRLRRTPIVILTTSKDEQDIFRCYDKGASSFITKPDGFGELVAAIRALNNYWFGPVVLPYEREECRHK